MVGGEGVGGNVRPRGCHPMMFGSVSGNSVFLSRSAYGAGSAMRFRNRACPIIGVRVSDASRPFCANGDGLISATNHISHFVDHCTGLGGWCVCLFWWKCVVSGSEGYVPA